MVKYMACQKSALEEIEPCSTKRDPTAEKSGQHFRNKSVESDRYIAFDGHGELIIGLKNSKRFLTHPVHEYLGLKCIQCT